MQRKVIHIPAESSPNVELALNQIAAGLEPSNEVVVSGLLTYAEYLRRRATWDRARQVVHLDGKFYMDSK